MWVINILTSDKARLLITDNQNVDIAHEALIRHWSRLKGWIDKDKNATKNRRYLEKVAQEWEAKGKKEKLVYVLSEKELEMADNYPIDSIPLSDLLQEYIRVSQRVRGKGSIAIRENTEIKLRDRANNIQLLLNKNPQDESALKSVIELVRDNYKQEQNLGILGSVKSVLYQTLSIVIKQENSDIKLGDNFIEMKGHTDNITSVAISPDNKTIVSGSQDGTIRLWDINGNPINETFDQEDNKITSVAIASNGDIVSGSEDNTVRLRDKNGEPIAEYKHDQKVTSVAITPDGETIVSGSYDETVRLWDREGNSIGEPLHGHQDYVTAVAITPDGETIVSGSSDETVCIWNKEGKLVSQITDHQDEVMAVAISNDGQTIVTGDLSGAIYWWNGESKKISQSTQQHSGVNSISITPNGNTLVIGGMDRKLRLWSRNKQQNQWIKIGSAIDIGWTINSVAITADEKRIIIGGENKTMRLCYCGNWQDWLGIICLISKRRGLYSDLCSQVQKELNLPPPDDLTKYFSKLLNLQNETKDETEDLW